MIGVAGRVGENPGRHRDHTVSGAVLCWGEDGGVAGSGAGEIGECAARNRDVGFNEIA